MNLQINQLLLGFKVATRAKVKWILSRSSTNIKKVLRITFRMLQNRIIKLRKMLIWKISNLKMIKINRIWGMSNLFRIWIWTMMERRKKREMVAMHFWETTKSLLKFLITLKQSVVWQLRHSDPWKDQHPDNLKMLIRTFKKRKIKNKIKKHKIMLVNRQFIHK